MGSGSHQQVNTSVTGNLGVLLTSMTSQDDENAQSILEEHCSRIWDSSEGQTPGHHSPKSWSPDRSFRPPDFRSQLAGPSPNVSASSVFNRSHHKRKEKEPHLTSLQSFDSGMGEDKSGVYKDHNSKYSSHHHYVPKDSKQKSLQDQEAALRQYYHRAQDTSLRSRADMHGLNMSWDDQNLRGRSREGKRTNTKKCSDTSSMIDSGVSVLYEPTNHPAMPNLHDPASEKWVWQQKYCFINVVCLCQKLNAYLWKCVNKTTFYWGDLARFVTLNETCNIRCTLVGNKIADHSDVARASPVGAAPTTSSFSRYTHTFNGLDKDNYKTRCIEVLGFGATYIRGLTVQLKYTEIWPAESRFNMKTCPSSDRDYHYKD